MKSLCRLVLLVAFTASAFAQTVIKVADSSSSGTYKLMLSQVVEACGNDQFTISEAQGTGGAPGNLQALLDNTAEFAFLHSDVFSANAGADPMSYGIIKTLVPLYPEQIHVLALRVSKTKKPGAFSWGTLDFNSLSDARGFKVGAAGGGVITARLLNGQGEGGFSVIQFDTGDQVINSLNSGGIDLAIFVGAQPLPNLSKLPKDQYKLLPIGENIASKVSGVYRISSVNYPGLTNGPVRTLAPEATLMTKKFSTPAKIEMQRKLRACFMDHLADLKDSGARAWMGVDATNTGVLNNYLELPAAKTVARK